MKEFHTNGGSIVQKDGFGRFKVDGKQVSAKQVKNLVKSHGGVTEVGKHSSSRDKRFHEMQRRVKGL